MGINSKLQSERLSSVGGSLPRRLYETVSNNWESMSMSRFSSVSASPSAITNNRLWQKELQSQLQNLPQPEDIAYIDYSMMVDQLEDEINNREADIRKEQDPDFNRVYDQDADVLSDIVMEDREEMLYR